MAGVFSSLFIFDGISNLATRSAVVVVEAFNDCLVVLDPLGDAALGRFFDQTKLVRHVLGFV